MKKEFNWDQPPLEGLEHINQRSMSIYVSDKRIPTAIDNIDSTTLNGIQKTDSRAEKIEKIIGLFLTIDHILQKDNSLGEGRTTEYKLKKIVESHINGEMKVTLDENTIKAIGEAIKTCKEVGDDK